MTRHALVFGATGLIGRNLVLALGAAGVRVSTATRSRESYERLVRWLTDHGQDEAPIDLRVDFDATPIIETDGITEIFNCAGAYRFGMSMTEARRANVDTVRAILTYAAGLPNLGRVVHVSGYRVGGRQEWSEATYQKLGAYEASKIESDTVFQTTADALRIPWSIVNPATVIGDSVTGESDQYLGLAVTLKDLYRGKLPGIPGNAQTFVPVVAVDYLARFMTLLPDDPAADRTSYWLLDDNTPALPELVELVAGHYGVKAPRLRIPVALIRRLPRWLTKADPETLSFLSTDRYPTASANAFAARHNLEMPDTEKTILRWADHLAAHHFGEPHVV
jgi:nucleoside-diphosphate-sugar epimerase